ncbi:DUF2207 domain-containing protein [Flavobacterium muglaense]|uniref:DUF2207 domain-containing protein n=1 Tax=Flavobacterium muglaense TaxID=2764716 RepID=A0A923N162_9FLAO|nr:DUF2207 domain-containing protein [Flavobacterium muglaense]MBC5838921.1 DUF2207 domain-containing protein [Flavobacterium muglaense]MBC5845424.1 DUF2207 domain-containing protein [Flavobacterium muglaense]
MRVVQVKKIVVFISLLFFFYGNAQERIIHFDTKIQIQHSGIIQVTENIQIKAEGNQFKHGLLRVLPLNRKDKDGNDVDLGYEISSIKKDGIEEPYFTKEEDDFYKIYIGSKDRELDAGTYTYQITYSMPYQIGYFEGYDELYWNVTGNDWEFSIDHATCEIYLPTENAEFKSLYSYSGAEGAKGSNANNLLINNKTVASFSIDGLRPYEGLTVAASFDKGLVLPPSTLEKSASFYKQIKEMLWSVLFGIAALFFCYYQRFVKKRNRSNAIIPEFRPPFDWSPAIVGYVYNNGFNDEVYMASVINTAVKGAIKINETIDEGVFTNSKIYEIEVLKKTPSNLSDEEEAFFKPLANRVRILVSMTSYKIFEKAYNAWQNRVTKQIKIDTYHVSTTRKKIVGFLLLVNVGLIFLLLSKTKGYANYAFLMIAIVGSVGVTLWIRNKIEHIGLMILRGLLCFFWVIPTVFIYIVSLFMVTWMQLGVQVILILAYIVYVYNIEKHTQIGIEAMERIGGFKLYLETAEKDRINMLNPPEQTPELFEELLPYAIALDVDVAWGKQFENVLELAKYDPAWYSGNEGFYITSSGFVSSFGKSVSASRVDPTPPRSSSGSSSSSSSGSSGSWSSGSSGGGSSGGGGGGGGGGGW